MDGLLFVDDEEGIRRSMVRALRKESFKTYTAGTGEEGIDFARRNRSMISSVISDYKMPGLNGLETLSIIGEILPDATRIILTGYATMETAIQATNEGIDGFLTKPFDNAEIRAKLHEIHIRRRLKQFVPEHVYQQIHDCPNALEPSFHQASILFSDIRGFTQMSQEVSPETLVSFLNHDFFDPMGEIVYQYNGSLDKHIGDSMMAGFGTPIPMEDNALCAVNAAIAMQKEADQINKSLDSRHGLKLRIGIGISTGRVFSGIMGSVRKKEFTSIGMAVNIAARLQGLAKEGEIVISQDTYDLLSGQIQAVALPPVRIKGISDPVSTYRVTF